MMKSDFKSLALCVILMLLSIGDVSAKSYLVAVGVADYSKFPGGLNSLTLTTADAQSIVDVYSKNSSVDYALLLDAKATRSRILKAIEKVHSLAGEDDTVVFFFSGHGYDGGFCAYDGTLSYRRIRRAMAKSKCKNKVIFADACRSGGMRVEAASTSSGEQNADTETRNASVMMFLASRTKENSLESTVMTNGYFTTYLLKGLKGNADTNRDRIITAKELFDFVHNGVDYLSSGYQHPVMWGRFSDDMPVMKW